MRDANVDRDPGERYLIYDLGGQEWDVVADEGLGVRRFAPREPVLASGGTRTRLAWCGALAAAVTDAA